MLDVTIFRKCAFILKSVTKNGRCYSRVYRRHHGQGLHTQSILAMDLSEIVIESFPDVGESCFFFCYS